MLDVGYVFYKQSSQNVRCFDIMYFSILNYCILWIHEWDNCVGCRFRSVSVLSLDVLLTFCLYMCVSYLRFEWLLFCLTLNKISTYWSYIFIFNVNSEYFTSLRVWYSISLVKLMKIIKISHIDHTSVPSIESSSGDPLSNKGKIAELIIHV